jgi:cystathionine gamma-synthase
MKPAAEVPTKVPLASEAVHAGEPREHPYHAIAAPIVQTATYTFGSTQDLVQYMRGGVEREEYGRYGNPTTQLVERKIAELEGAEEGLAFSSGMAAITTAILAFCKSGSHVVLFADGYRRTRQFVVQVLQRFGVSHTVVDSSDLADIEAAIQPTTRVLVTETPTNPYLRVLDLPRVADLCRRKRVKTIVDTTFATPINLRPVEWGVDLVVHSATKYLAGHNDVLGGVLVGNRATLSLVQELRDVLGSVPDPHASYLVLRGMKTLALRVQHQNQTALYLARELESHPRVARVWYPGLSSHPDHAVASTLMGGYGGVFTFEIRGGLEDASRCVDALRIPRIGPSLGGVESLVEQPALMSYFELSEDERNRLGIRGSVIRYSAGIECATDLKDDLVQALDRVGPADSVTGG